MSRRFNELMRHGDHAQDANLIQAAVQLENLIAGNLLHPPVVLFRGVGSDFASELRRSQVGHIFFDPGFISTSRHLAIARRFSAIPPGGVVLAITSAYPVAGLDVSEWSDHDEAEVILAPGTGFRISGFDAGARVILVEVVNVTQI